MPSDIISLPWQVQLTLASGYAAYVLAYTGIRAHHKTIETAFGTLVFGLITTFTLWALTASLGLPVVGSSILAFLTTIAVGALWRLFGRRLLRKALRKLRISHADDDPSAWHALSDDTANDVTAIAVKLDDGSWLRCDDTKRFEDAPHGPCILGSNGDIAIYCTHITSATGDEKEQPTVSNEEFGSRLTYVPASKIARVTLRHKRHQSS